MNGLKTTMLLAALTALFGSFGYLFGGTVGALIALSAAAVMNAVTYWNADKIVLKMHDAREVDDRSAPELAGIVRDLAKNAGLPMPRVYVVNDNSPNAFATGRNPDNAAVAATSGLLSILSHDEVVGVIAHELAHIRNRDTLIMTMVATIAGAISMIANFALFFRGGDGRGPGLAGIAAVLVAPFAAMIVQMAISRTREYGADEGGAQISGKPLALASALDKLARGAKARPGATAARVPATAQLYIVPGLGRDSVFSTHPDTANRIAALKAMAATGNAAGRPAVLHSRTSLPLTRSHDRVRRASALNPARRRF